MSKLNISKAPVKADSSESFGTILSQFERSHTSKSAEGLREGTVVSLSSDSVFIDLGFKTEGVLPLSEFPSDAESRKTGDKLQVTIKGRDPEGYYLLTRSKARAARRIGRRWKEHLPRNRRSSAQSPGW